MRIWQFLRMNPLSFTISSIMNDQENIIEELKKVFDVIHVVGVEGVQRVVYQLKNVAWTLFD